MNDQSQLEVIVEGLAPGPLSAVFLDLDSQDTLFALLPASSGLEFLLYDVAGEMLGQISTEPIALRDFAILRPRPSPRPVP